VLTPQDKERLEEIADRIESLALRYGNPGGSSAVAGLQISDVAFLRKLSNQLGTEQVGGDCEACGGSGEDGTEPCGECNGSGKRRCGHCAAVEREAAEQVDDVVELWAGRFEAAIREFDQRAEGCRWEGTSPEPFVFAATFLRETLKQIGQPHQLGTGGGDEGLRAALEHDIACLRQSAKEYAEYRNEKKRQRGRSQAEEADHLQALLDVNPPATPVQDEVGEDGAALIAAERRRQVEAEGWTPEHDDQHDQGELAQAAAAYALHAGAGLSKRVYEAERLWPFTDGWKPSANEVRELVKAGALIAAEIDRLQRLDATQPEPHQGLEGPRVEGIAQDFERFAAGREKEAEEETAAPTRERLLGGADCLREAARHLRLAHRTDFETGQPPKEQGEGGDDGR